MKNPYRPILQTIRKITVENEAKDLKTFQLAFCSDAEADNFRFRCGQFAELTVFGVGECPIGIASSPMEREILELAVKGLRNKAIADKLSISVRTVEGHFNNIFAKLHVGSRVEAILYAVSRHIVTLEAEDMA